MSIILEYNYVYDIMLIHYMVLTDHLFLFIMIHVSK